MPAILFFPLGKKISPCYDNKDSKMKLPLNFAQLPCTKRPRLAAEKEHKSFNT